MKMKSITMIMNLYYELIKFHFFKLRIFFQFFKTLTNGTVMEKRTCHLKKTNYTPNSFIFFIIPGPNTSFR